MRSRALCVGILALVAAGASEAQVERGRASDAKMAEHAARAVLGSASPATRQSRAETASRALQDAGRERPGEQAVATFLFRRGLGEHEVDQFLKPGVEAVDVEIKAPVGDTGEVWTAFVGAQRLQLVAALPGSRMERIVGIERYRLLKESDAVRRFDQRKSDELKAMSQSKDLRIFSIRLLGTHEQLARLERDNISVVAAATLSTKEEANAWAEYVSRARGRQYGVVVGGAGVEPPRTPPAGPPR